MKCDEQTRRNGHRAPAAHGINRATSARARAGNRINVSAIRRRRILKRKKTGQQQQENGYLITLLSLTKKYLISLCPRVHVIRSSTAPSILSTSNN